jgi:hypothetical protein
MLFLLLLPNHSSNVCLRADSAVTLTDIHFGMVMDELERSGLANETLVVVVAGISSRLSVHTLLALYVQQLITPSLCYLTRVAHDPRPWLAAG